jgi:hypothetical protein
MSIREQPTRSVPSAGVMAKRLNPHLIKEKHFDVLYKTSESETCYCRTMQDNGWLGNLKERGHYEDTAVGRRIILR